MTTHTPLFTVATVSFNSGQWVREAIESILASSFHDFELIISDDCSRDDTWEIIREYKDPRIRAWRNESNLGEYPNRNRVLGESKGRYIIFVDGDDVLFKDTLSEIAGYVNQYPEAVSIWGVSTKEMQFCICPVMLQPTETMRWIYAANLPISVIGFAETVFKVETLRKIGGFSERFISGDTYIKKRIALEGPVLLVPIGFMFWRQSENQASRSLSKGYKGYLNNVLIDREILSDSFFEYIPRDVVLFKKNCKVRDVKVLIGDILLKGEVAAAVQLWRQLQFRVEDLRALLQKADFSYLGKLNSLCFKGREVMSKAQLKAG